MEQARCSFKLGMLDQQLSQADTLAQQLLQLTELGHPEIITQLGFMLGMLV
jgi:hypothetical protein